MKQVKLKIVTMVALLAAGMGSVSAQPLSLTLEKAIEVALSESPTVKIAEKDVERKVYAKKEVVSKLIPSVNGQAGWTYTIQKQEMSMDFGGESMSIKVGRTNQLNAAVSLSLPVIAPTLWQNLNVSEADIERSVEAAHTSKLDMVKAVKNAFFNVLLSENSFDVIRKNYDQTVANYKNVAEKFRIGATSEYEMIRSEVQVRNLEPNVFQAESAVKSAYLQLKALLGMNPLEEIKVSGDWMGLEKEMYATLIATDSVKLDNNPTLRKLDKEIAYMKASLKMQKMQRLPSLSLNGNYSLMTMSDDFKMAHYYWFPYSTVGLTLNVPIFEGLAKNHREKQTKIGIETIQLQKIDVERNLATQRQMLVDNVSKAIKQVESSKKGVDLATRGYEIARKRYDIGAGSFLEYNDAEVALLQSQLSYNQALYGYVTARNDLENLTGEYKIK